MNRSLYLIMLSFVLSIPAVNAQVSPSSIEDVIAKEMPVSKTPGLAYAVVKDGELIQEGARGVLDNRQSAKATEDSLFLLGSVSKSFTALAIMQLVENGQLDLDAPFSLSLENFTDTPLAKVTIRQLLSHTSGLSTIQGNQSQTDYSTDTAALQRRVESLLNIKPASQSGTEWTYSNANYQILGRIIEVTSGMDFATYIEQKILKPIGMNNSYVFDGKSRDALANGHRPWFGTKRALTDNKTGSGSAPQGGIVSSAREVALYLAVMMNAKDDIISAAGKQQMMSSASKVSLRYGFGWFVNTKMGLVFHPGSNPGYEALVTMRPEESEAAVVLVNAGSGFGIADTNQLRYGITAAALNLPYPGEAGMASNKALFIFLSLLPLIFILGMLRTWRKRELVKSRSTFVSKAALWLPLVLAVLLAWALLKVVPSLFGATYGAAAVFQPDMGLVLATVSILALAWAILRICIAWK